jgi:hypothetical protein
MKRTIFVLLTILVVFVIVFAMLLVHPVRTVKAQQHGCSNRTLFGDYVMTASGQATKSSVTLPASLVGLLHFEGNGDLTGSNFYLLGNGSLSGPDTLSGASYDVNSDCTVTRTFESGWTTNGVIVGGNGSEVIGEMIPPNGLATVDIRKVSASDLLRRFTLERPSEYK